MRLQVDTQKKLCDLENAEAKKAVKAAHSVIRDYIKSLSLLAGSGLFILTPDIQTIETAVLKLPQVSEDERQNVVKSASLITQIISEIILERYQKEKIASVVTASDESLRILTATLNKSIAQYYTNGLLESEISEMNRVYATPILYSGNILNVDTKGGLPQYVSTTMMLQWNEAVDKINVRKELAKEYSQLLSSLSCEHSRLSDRLTSSKDAELRNELCLASAAFLQTPGNQNGLDIVSKTLYFEQKLTRLDQIAKSLLQ
ncbi:MAG: hypothetical protein WBN89_09565 [Prochlorococcaceae cyanobacterium]